MNLFIVVLSQSVRGARIQPKAPSDSSAKSSALTLASKLMIKTRAFPCSEGSPRFFFQLRRPISYPRAPPQS
jgi:hypothetical protein